MSNNPHRSSVNVPHTKFFRSSSPQSRSHSRVRPFSPTRHRLRARKSQKSTRRYTLHPSASRARARGRRIDAPFARGGPSPEDRRGDPARGHRRAARAVFHRRAHRDVRASAEGISAHRSRRALFGARRRARVCGRRARRRRTGRDRPARGQRRRRARVGEQSEHRARFDRDGTRRE